MVSVNKVDKYNFSFIDNQTFCLLLVRLAIGKYARLYKHESV